MLLLCPDGQKPLVVKAETFEPWDLALDRTDAPLEARKDPRRLIISYLPQNASPGSPRKPRVRPRYRDSSRETEMLDVWEEVQLDGGSFLFWAE